MDDQFAFEFIGFGVMDVINEVCLRMCTWRSEVKYLGGVVRSEIFVGGGPENTVKHWFLGTPSPNMSFQLLGKWLGQPKL